MVDVCNRHTHCVNLSRSWNIANDENPSAVTLVICLYTNLRNKNESKNRGGANQEPSAEQSRKQVGEFPQSVGRNNNHCEHNAGDVNGRCNILGIIKALDLHLAN